MSHHLDSPLARQDPRLDISDLYVFLGTMGTVFVMDVNPLSGAGGFHPEGRYEFRVDTDGDAVEDFTYVFTFGEPDSGGDQPLNVHRLDGADSRTRESAGTAVAQGSTGQEIEGAGGVRIWAGPVADPFYINGDVVGAVKGAIMNGTSFDLADIDYGEAKNLFAGTNVSAIVLEIPDNAFEANDIGVWGTTALATDSGGWVQINRCATPLVNTIFNSDDSEGANVYNTTPPSEDKARYGSLVSDLVTKAVAATGSSDDPAEHGLRVVDLIFPDVLHYRVGTPEDFGFVVRNGRGLSDCAPEVMFTLVLNKAVPLGLDSRSAAGVAGTDFPYLAPPV